MTKPVTVLVVEDNPDNLELMRYLLEASGYRVVQARDGSEALVAALGMSPDLVVTDLHMPHMDGFEFVRALRDHADLRAVPVVAVTASAMMGDRHRVLSSGFNGYLSKPIDPEQFVTQVTSYLPGPRPAPDTEP